MTVSLNLLALVSSVALAVTACGGSSPSPSTPTTPAQPAADGVLVNVDDAGVALHGHDPVAYVVDSAVTPGSDAHASRHGGATYWFSTAEHKATFDADPERFVPRFGGYCAYAVTQNRLSDVQPDQWKLQDGKLLLFTNAELRERFDQDAAGNLALANRNWPALVARSTR
ncbi:MAG: hypothetical protein JWP01_492 [Myxococcales bacterium]|nr:hypothetical protein [Myxococcales bacterium]